MNSEQIQFARMAAAIEYLYDHAQEQPSLAAVAAQVHVSAPHLQRQFQAWAGVSPKKMLQHISIKQAKQVLQQQGSVQEAAWQAGLSGGGRLHDLFVHIEGMTPGEYKSGGAGLRIDYAFAPTPFGEVLVAATAKGVCFMAFADERAQALADLAAEYPAAERVQQASPLHARALAVFGGGTPDTVPLHLKASVGCLKMPAQTVGCAPLGAHALFVLNACLKDDFCFEEKRFVCFRQALRAGNAFAPEGKYSMITGYGLLDVN